MTECWSACRWLLIFVAPEVGVHMVNQSRRINELLENRTIVIGYEYEVKDLKDVGDEICG